MECLKLLSFSEGHETNLRSISMSVLRYLRGHNFVTHVTHALQSVCAIVITKTLPRFIRNVLYFHDCTTGVCRNKQNGAMMHTVTCNRFV